MFLDIYRSLRNSDREADRRENRWRLQEITQRPLTELETAWKESLLNN